MTIRMSAIHVLRKLGRMANPNPSPSSRRSAKPHKVKSIKLAEHLCPIVEQSTIGGATAVLELGAEMIQFLASEAANENQKAIALLARFGVEAKIEEEQPIVVLRPDGSVGAWII